MTDLINIATDSAAVAAALERFERAGAHLGPAMRKIAATLADVTEDNFAAQGRPQWKASARAQAKGGMTLQDTGRLAASITTHSDDHSAAVGSNVIYAAIHQFGGQTSAHTIRPKYAKALHFNGRFAKVVHHPGSDIPARPYLPMTASGALQPEAERPILDTIRRHLLQAAEG